MHPSRRSTCRGRTRRSIPKSRWLYQQITHPKNAQFAYLNCWHVLRTVPKWQDLRHRRPESNNTPSKKRSQLDYVIFAGTSHRRKCVEVASRRASSFSLSLPEGNGEEGPYSGVTDEHVLVRDGFVGPGPDARKYITLAAGHVRTHCRPDRRSGTVGCLPCMSRCTSPYRPAACTPSPGCRPPPSRSAPSPSATKTIQRLFGDDQHADVRETTNESVLDQTDSGFVDRIAIASSPMTIARRDLADDTPINRYGDLGGLVQRPGSPGVLPHRTTRWVQQHGLEPNTARPSWLVPEPDSPPMTRYSRGQVYGWTST